VVVVEWSLLIVSFSYYINHTLYIYLLLHRFSSVSKLNSPNIFICIYKADEEKEPYNLKAVEAKENYATAMKAYNAGQASAGGGGSKVKDEEEDEDEEEDDDRGAAVKDEEDEDEDDDNDGMSD
jgi:hypothetical protein